MRGFRPRGRPTFWPARKWAKSGPCSAAHPLRGRVPCDARPTRPRRTHFATLRSNKRRESALEACCARALSGCASRRLQRGTPKQPAARMPAAAAAGKPGCPTQRSFATIHVSATCNGVPLLSEIQRAVSTTATRINSSKSITWGHLRHLCYAAHLLDKRRRLSLHNALELA